MKLATILLAACLATSAASQTLEDEPWIDFDLLFAQNPDAITPDTDSQGNPTSVLNLPGEVRIIRRGTAPDHTYCTADRSDKGATGEVMVILVGLRLTADRCPAFATPAQISELDALLRRVGPFLAQNTVPPQSWPSLQQQLISLMPVDAQLSCENAMDEDGWSKSLLNASLSADFDGEVALLLATPKLPVLDTCR